jgi:hypothetical protein
MSVLQLPPDTEKMRKVLFEMPVPFSMRAEEFERYWPLIDNVWSRYDEVNVRGRDRIPYDSIRFACRFARKFENEPTRAINPLSKRQRREGGTCSCRVKAKRFHGINGLPDHYQFDHSSQKECDWAHSHSIEESDSIKINGFLKAAAAVEAAKGYMPAEVYKTLRSVKIFDEDGVPIGDALDVAGGKFMTRMHANNAKQSALSAKGGKFLKRQPPNDVNNLLKRPHIDSIDRGSRMTEMIVVDPSTIWPTTLGKVSQDHEEHAKYIKNDIRSLVESIAIGARTHVPREVLLPLLNSMAEYMDEESEDVEGKPLLQIILRVQETASLVKKESSTSVSGRNGNHHNGNGYG